MVQSWTDTLVTCLAPIGNKTNNLCRVTVAGPQNASINALNYYNPIISSVSASSLPTAGGTTLVLSGQSFDLFGSVTVNGRACPVTAWGHSSISCTLPSGGGANRAVVVTTIAPATSLPFLISYDVPVISSTIPTTLSQAGQLVTLMYVATRPSTN